ncbi:indolepyruvate ferredoxin oxidoreductase family protein [Henriciella sp. AS95]|uniref:indolepyruvate ferredoxin oxidoreductase family protein n=1 Tax=Henriciella sp. AS95 TaxID=3135782 RepID=UPI00316F1573
MQHGTLLSGLEALALLPLLQSDLDRASNLNTAAFISGYRGSPLGGLDQMFKRKQVEFAERSIVFQPGVNEELAATAVWGSQQGQVLQEHRFDGVFAMWYGKGPGVDRAGDALRHGNLAGAAEHGGVLVVAGDDHQGKSSTTAHQSDHTLASFSIPVLAPSTIPEIIEFGLKGWAMSRYSGLWIGLKCVNELAEASTISPLPSAPVINRPNNPAPAPPEGVNVQWRYEPMAADARLQEFRLPRIHEFARANEIDRVITRPAHKRIGIVTSGKAYGDVLDALDLLGLNPESAADLGIGIYKIGLVWPIDPDAARRFAEGYDELIIVEEKRNLIEDQIRAALYDLPEPRPAISGKMTSGGQYQLPAAKSLDARTVAGAILPKLRARDIEAPRASALDEPGPAALLNAPAPISRLPYFCSGCPHNRSTKVEDGEIALSGIGCHTMAMWMDRKTLPPTQMGGEGANWVGMAPFSNRQHIFQNLGDGTYFHSGTLAIRQAVAGKVNITYKVLFNDAVAMTGGQEHDGALSPEIIASQCLAEGVAEVAIVAEFPKRYRTPLPGKVKVYPRTEFETVQKQLAQIPGVTVLIFDQVCAAEKRRMRKRGQLETPAEQVEINEAVCEGCGDCSKKSNCVSIAPLKTPLGVKRRIDHASCNQDFSCVEGFCPSFVSIEGKQVESPPSTTGDIKAPAAFVGDSSRTWNVLLTGIGGTGIVTLGQIISRAAKIEGRTAHTFDMTGLAQKNGAVVTHVRIGNDEPIKSPQIQAGEADVLIACDPIAATQNLAFPMLNPDHTIAIADEHAEPTAHFQLDPDFQFSESDVQAYLAGGVRDLAVLSAHDLAREKIGGPHAANLILLGAAAQSGYLPVKIESIEAAIQELGVSVSKNLAALQLGRSEIIAAGSRRGSGEPTQTLSPSRQFLTEKVRSYGGSKLAERFEQLVKRAEAAEADVSGTPNGFADAVASSYAKLLTYKDEYEVARLLTSPEFEQRLREKYGAKAKVSYHMAPPVIARKSGPSGHPQKIKFGPWMRPCLKILAKFSFLRGTPFDPFGWTEDRKLERQLIPEFEALVDRAIASLDETSLHHWTGRIEAIQHVRGYGHVKAQNYEDWRKQDGELEQARSARTSAGATP